MRQEQRAELKAWAISLGVHGVIFVLVALSGVFLLVKPVQEAEPVEVALLEDAGAAGGGNAGGGSPAPAPVSSIAPMEVNMPAQNLPPIQESYTKEPQKQQEYRQQHQTQSSAAAGTAAKVESASGGNESGTKGQGRGNGTAAGAGQAGTGTGSGSGSGVNTGNGSGAGAGHNTARTERVAARCIYRPSPAYPENLRQQGVEGSVRVRILVAEDDSIESVEVVKSSGYPAMDAAAVSAARGCRFQMNGRRGRYTTTYSFQLADGDDW